MNEISSEMWRQGQEATLLATEAVSALPEQKLDRAAAASLSSVLEMASMEAFGASPDPNKFTDSLLLSAELYLHELHALGSMGLDRKAGLDSCGDYVIRNFLGCGIDVIRDFENRLASLGEDAVRDARNQAYGRFFSAIIRAFPDGKPFEAPFTNGHTG